MVRTSLLSDEYVAFCAANSFFKDMLLRIFEIEWKCVANWWFFLLGEMIIFLFELLWNYSFTTKFVPNILFVSWFAVVV